MNTNPSTLTAVVASESISDYKDNLSQAMWELALNPRTIFLGQGMDKGTFMSMTLQDVPKQKKLEFPVAEEMQLGVSIGLALNGMIPVSIYPRWNFLILAANQLVNHVDKMKPHVIIRVGVGSTKPLHPGPQHVGDYSEAFKSLCPNTRFVTLARSEQILPLYEEALSYNGPTVLTEIADEY